MHNKLSNPQLYWGYYEQAFNNNLCNFYPAQRDYSLYSYFLH